MDNREEESNVTYIQEILKKYVETDQDPLPLDLKQFEKDTNFTDPHELYPNARSMKRKIVYHGGPTNSGKTYEALQRLKMASGMGGIYCGPLRLLALEVYEKLNIDGIFCQLVTGQDKRYIPSSLHTSCTIEMCNIDKVYDVAVLDEIQLISDTERGWAWTRAFLGLQAYEIHVCGSMEAAGTVGHLMFSTDLYLHL